MLQVNCHAELVLVQELEKCAGIGCGEVIVERAEPSPRITVTRPFNLDYVGAVVGEELGAEGPGGIVGQIKDPGPGKGLWRRDGFWDVPT